MRVKFKIKSAFLLVSLCVSFVLPFFRTQAAGLSLNQSILPVKMVYLDSRDRVDSIWSNVSDSDTIYAVKFIRKKSNEEISMRQDILNRFQQESTKNVSAYGWSGNGAGEKFSQLSVNFVQKNDQLEEIRTYV